MIDRQARVGCGAAIIRGAKILLVQRLTAPEALHWSLPGGKVDWMESVEDATVREIEEELGIRIADLRLLCVADHIDKANEDHWVAPVFIAGSFSGEPQLLEPAKHGAMDWFPLRNLPEPLTIATKIALEAIQSNGSLRPD